MFLYFLLIPDWSGDTINLMWKIQIKALETRYIIIGCVCEINKCSEESVLKVAMNTHRCQWIHSTNNNRAFNSLKRSIWEIFYWSYFLFVSFWCKGRGIIWVTRASCDCKKCLYFFAVVIIVRPKNWIVLVEENSVFQYTWMV